MADDTIYLASHDFEPVLRRRPEGVRKQVTVAHEFGHAAGNSAKFSMGDEYRKSKGPVSPHVADQQSIMNIGHSLRARHFRKLIEQLNAMIPDAQFSVVRV